MAFLLDRGYKVSTVGSMNSFTIHRGGATLAYKTFLFPDGAVGFKLDHDNHRFRTGRYERGLDDIQIVARIKSSEDVMELIMATDALRRWTNDEVKIRLVLPCCAYQRQDRLCVEGEAFSLKAFAVLINAQSYSSVTIFDPHSDVAGAVFDRVRLVKQPTIIGRFDAFNARLQPVTDRPVFVSPDAGANKRVAELAGLFTHPSFIRADKLRDLATGKIKEIVVVNPREDVEGRDCVIVDDLCDAGGTFIGLAAALKAKGARRVELYVTHGLFTKGVNALFPGIDAVWTTNSYRTDLSDPRLTVLNLEEVFSL